MSLAGITEASQIPRDSKTSSFPKWGAGEQLHEIIAAITSKVVPNAPRSRTILLREGPIVWKDGYRSRGIVAESVILVVLRAVLIVRHEGSNLSQSAGGGKEKNERVQRLGQAPCPSF